MVSSTVDATSLEHWDAVDVVQRELSSLRVQHSTSTCSAVVRQSTNRELSYLRGLASLSTAVKLTNTNDICLTFKVSTFSYNFEITIYWLLSKEVHCKVLKMLTVWSLDYVPISIMLFWCAEKLADCLRLPAALSLQAQVFLCFRVLLLRISSQHLTALWPTIITELVSYELSAL